MKKVMMLVVLASLIPAAASFPVDIALGARAGAGASFFSGSDWDLVMDGIGEGENKLLFAYTAGVSLDIGLTGFLSVQPGISFSRVGTAYDFIEQTVMLPAEGTMTANVIQASLLLKPRLRLGTVTLYFLAGPAMFYILDDLTEKIEIQNLTSEEPFDPDRNLVWGVAAGVGYSFPVGFAAVLAELRYNRTLTEFLAPNNNTSINEFFLELGLEFPLARTAR